MAKFVLFFALFSTAALAQEPVRPVASRAPVIENMPKQADEPKYCVYEDKNYSEGAIKTVDGRTMICMAEDGVVFSSQGPRKLEWVYGESFRGQVYLKASSMPKK